MNQNEENTLGLKATGNGVHYPNGKCFATTDGESRYGNARLIAAACNSYHKHFGPNAFEMAVDDVLGECLEALEGVLRVADRKTVEFDLARSVLSKVKENQ